MTDPGHIALLRRKTDVSHAEFSRHWLHQHAPLVIPWALARGCLTYIQYHNISVSTVAKDGNLATPPDMDIDAYDGGAVMRFGGTPPPAFTQTEKLDEYFTEVVRLDELRFLSGPAQEIAKYVDEKTVEGERIVLIENGKLAKDNNGQDIVDMADAWKLWEKWGFDSASLK